jgi:TATA-binding protein-associated factor
MRKLNERAAGSGQTTPTETPTPQPSPPRGNGALPPASEAVTIDPGAKARARAAAGGQVEPLLDAEGNVITGPSQPKIALIPGQSPWVAVLLEIVPSLSDPTWQARHGGGLAVMEIIRSTSLEDDAFLLFLARELLNLLALDRFGDFVGDTVIAPVRETAAQALGVTLKYLSLSGVREVHETLMGMVIQSWAKRGKEAEGRPKSERFSWEVRHAGLLGLKYEVAVRPDLLAEEVTAKAEAKMEVEVDEKPDLQRTGLSIMNDVVDAAIIA